MHMCMLAISAQVGVQVGVHESLPHLFATITVPLTGPPPPYSLVPLAPRNLPSHHLAGVDADHPVLRVPQRGHSDAVRVLPGCG